MGGRGGGDERSAVPRASGRLACSAVQGMKCSSTGWHYAIMPLQVLGRGAHCPAGGCGGPKAKMVNKLRHSLYSPHDRLCSPCQCCCRCPPHCRSWIQGRGAAPDLPGRPVAAAHNSGERGSQRGREMKGGEVAGSPGGGVHRRSHTRGDAHATVICSLRPTTPAPSPHPTHPPPPPLPPPCPPLPPPQAASVVGTDFVSTDGLQLVLSAASPGVSFAHAGVAAAARRGGFGVTLQWRGSTHLIRFW